VTAADFSAMDKAKFYTLYASRSGCSSSAIVPSARTRQNWNRCPPVTPESLTPLDGCPSWRTHTVDHSRMMNDLCECPAFHQTFMSTLGQKKLLYRVKEGSQCVLASPISADCGCQVPLRASLCNETAFNGSPARPSSHDAGMPGSSDIESDFGSCSVALHICIEYSAAHATAAG